MTENNEMHAQRMRQIYDIVIPARDAYYNGKESGLTDDVYDSLIRELEALEVLYGEHAREDSPTRQVGAKVEEDSKNIIHRTPMLSLGNVFTPEDLIEWIYDVEAAYVGWELKYDGLAISATYVNGVLVALATRGDGEVGECILRNAEAIRGLPLVTDLQPNEINGIVEVRGEVVMPRAELVRLNEGGLKRFANCRNAAAGSLRLKDSTECATRGLVFLPYDVIGSNVSVTSLHKHGFNEIPRKGEIVRSSKTASIDEQVLAVLATVAAMRDSLPIDIDGIVFKVSDLERRKALGYNSREPKWAIAYKFPASQTTSVVESIEVQVGRTGALTPVAKIRPVQLHGVTISSISLYNFKLMMERDISVGDTVVVERAGDVIPKIASVLTKAEVNRIESEKLVPKCCPACGGPVRWEMLSYRKAGAVHLREGAVLYCTSGWRCGGQTLQRLAHFVSRDALDVDGLAEATLKALIEKGYVKYPSDLFQLDKAKLLTLEGFAERSADNLLASLRKARGAKLERVLYGIGIPEVGVSTSKALARVQLPGEVPGNRLASFIGWPDLVAVLINIDDIGEKTASEIYNFFNDRESVSVVTKLIGCLDIEEPAVVSGGSMSGMTYVITGSFDNYSREALKETIEANGGKVSGSVSAKTTALVAGKGGGSKRKDAEKLGVPIISLEDVLAKAAIGAV